MGIYRGPNTVKDGLVFGYDTGYGVADNYTATRFYKGKPVDNIATDPTFLNNTIGTYTSSAWGGDTGFGEFATNTSPDGGGLMYINNNTSTSAGGGGNFNDHDVNNFTLINGVTYTRSWWAKSNITQTINGHMLSINGGGNNTYILGDSTDLVAGEWQRVSHTFTYSGTSNLDWRFRSINYNQSKVYIANIQLEVGSNASPFTATSRSSTESLIDLKKTTNIDVSNVSFDSTGQPDFDGTDDRIQSSTGINLSSYTSLTYEGVVKAVGLSSHDRWFSGTTGTTFHNPDLTIGDNGQLRYIFYNSGIASWVAPSGLTIDTTKYNHLIYTFTNTGVVKIYVNGVFKYTATHSNCTFPNDSRFMVGTRYDNNGEGVYGNISITKVYSKALTAEEVTQNYNAYKNRFNI